MNAISKKASGPDSTTALGSTPVIVGVGQVSERIDDDDYQARSPADLGGDAAGHRNAWSTRWPPASPPGGVPVLVVKRLGGVLRVGVVLVGRGFVF